MEDSSVSDGTQLVRYDAMCRAIAAAHAVDEVKDIRDKARAIEMYARQAQNTEAEERAREIRLRAERKCGQLLAVQIEHGGDRRSSSAGSNLKLKDLNISGDQSSQWQKLAAVPADLFEQALSEPNPSTSGIITRHEVAERPGGLVMDNHQALWLWGTLQDFERDGILDADPNELIGNMLDHMKATTNRLAPRVAAWLGRIRNE
jgi:hypothetical protein